MSGTVRSSASRPSLASPAEDERNRLLRRVDWRFLGGTPADATSIAFGDGLLTRSLAAISARVVDPTEPPHPAGCDIAAAIDPEPETLSRAWTALRPGGTLYTEWTRVRPGDPWGIRRRLARAGWVDLACYAPWPGSAGSTPRAWVPLNSTPAVRHFLRNRATPARYRQRVGRTVRRILWLASRKTGFGRPLCVIARKAAPDAEGPIGTGSAPGRRRADGDTDFQAELLATIREGWETWRLGPAPERPVLMLQTGGPRSVSKIVGLLFADGIAEPALVVKIPRVAESWAPLRREASVLRALEARRPELDGVPRVLFARAHAGVPTVGETVVAGVPVLTVVTEHNYLTLALRATRWAAGLAGSSQPMPVAGWWPRLVEPVIERFEVEFGAAIDRSELRDAASLLAQLPALPMVCEHRDFSPWNVLTTPDGRLGVLDWEGAELDGLPALDLLYFLTYLAFELDGARRSRRYRESYRVSADPSTRTGAAAADCLRAYSELTRMPSAALPPLRLLVWMMHARSEYARFHADAGGTPAPSTLAGSLFVALWREELRHA